MKEFYADILFGKQNERDTYFSRDTVSQDARGGISEETTLLTGNPSLTTTRKKKIQNSKGNEVTLRSLIS